MKASRQTTFTFVQKHKQKREYPSSPPHLSSLPLPSSCSPSLSLSSLSLLSSSDQFTSSYRGGNSKTPALVLGATGTRPASRCTIYSISCSLGCVRLLLPGPDAAPGGNDLVIMVEDGDVRLVLGEDGDGEDMASVSRFRSATPSDALPLSPCPNSLAPSSTSLPPPSVDKSTLLDVGSCNTRGPAALDRGA